MKAIQARFQIKENQENSLPVDPCCKKCRKKFFRQVENDNRWKFRSLGKNDELFKW